MVQPSATLTPKQVIEFYPELTTSLGTLANWRHQKTGPMFYKPSQRKVLYKREDIENFMFSHPVHTLDSMDGSV